jgi:hypothetical protein
LADDGASGHEVGHGAGAVAREGVGEGAGFDDLVGLVRGWGMDAGIIRRRNCM